MGSIKLKDTVRKRFIAAESDHLVIETIQTESKTCRQHLRILKIKGTWRANWRNELCFEASAAKGPPKTYTFAGGWKLNKNQQIEYTHTQSSSTLIFNGHWDISGAHRLVYFLEGSSTSRFEFKAQLESFSLVPKKGRIRFRLGAGIKRSRLRRPGRLIVLYGEWKFGRNLGLLFQMDYGAGRIQAIEFGARVTFGRGKVDFALKNESGKPLGVTLTMTHKFLKLTGSEAFIRLKSAQNERRIETGINLPF